MKYWPGRFDQRGPAGTVLARPSVRLARRLQSIHDPAYGVSSVKGDGLVSGSPSGASLLPLPASSKSTGRAGESDFGASLHNASTRKDLWIGWVEPACGEDWKCQVGSAARPVQAACGRAL